MICSSPFLNPAELEGIASRLEGLEEHMIERKTPDFKIFGIPTHTWIYGEKYDRKRIDHHNALMMKYFPTLLTKAQNFFSELLGETVYRDERLCLPGFHVITLKPGSEFKAHFHIDTDDKTIQTNFPDLNVEFNKSLITFTVLINDQPELDCGMLYFEEGSALEKKAQHLMKEGFSHDSFKKMASYFKYSTGAMNYQRNLLHSISATNFSEKTQRRITLQGNLAKTPKGRIFFW